MKASRNSILAALCAFALVGTVIARPTTRPFAQTAQPEMNLATVQLEEAKGARHPIVHLEKAKDDLQDARHNKAGERVEAMRHVNEAIEAARRNNIRAMIKHIDAALCDIRQVKRAARR